MSRLNAAGTAWEQPVGGASPINQSPTQYAVNPSLTAIGGTPYVAWQEADGINEEIRVSRLNGAGTAWEQVVGGASPINQSPTGQVSPASLTAIGGVPYVAWAELDGTGSEIRVSRLNGAGTAWEQVVGGASPINQDPTAFAFNPSLTGIGGVPYVAWQEPDGANDEMRVSRLNAAGTAWQQVVGGASPINQSPTGTAANPSLTAVGGVPYIAWYEFDGTNFEIRVSRPNGAETAWEQVVGGASPINQDPAGAVFSLRLTAIGGVPYVAWLEGDGTNTEVRVSRLNGAGTAWEQPVGGASPINQDPTAGASMPSPSAVGGIPYVAWTEHDGVNAEVRVSRLEPEFSNTTALPTDTGADLRTDVNTYGLAYPVGFDYGPGFASTTTTTATSGNPATITKHVAGLSPSTSYPFRPFATAGVLAPTVLGSAGSFTTSPQNGPGATGDTGPQGPTGPGGAIGPQGPAGRDALVTCKVKTKKRKPKIKCTVVFSQNARAVRLTLLRSGRVVDRARARHSGATRMLELDGGHGPYTLRILTLDVDGGRSVTRQPVRAG